MLEGSKNFHDFVDRAPIFKMTGEEKRMSLLVHDAAQVPVLQTFAVNCKEIRVSRKVVPPLDVNLHSF